VPWPIHPCVTAQLTWLPDLTGEDMWSLGQVRHHPDCMNSRDTRISQQLLLAGTLSFCPKSMSTHSQNSLDPCAGSCTRPGPWGRETHLQDDFNCEDRSEANVKVSENLGREAPELDEIWVTREMLQCVHISWHCGFALHSVA